MDDATLARALASVVVPGELEARRRSWQITRNAFAERERLPSPVVRGRWGPIVLAATLLIVAAAVLSPPGRAVIGDLRDAIGREQQVDITATQTSLFSLPAKGRLLVDSSRGPWLVQPDGSKRLLGSYREASWSPFGLYIVGAKHDALETLEPSGKLHWSLARPDVHGARWGGTRTDTRIAYLSGDSLHVVGGDGKDDRVLVKRVADVAPAWKPGDEHVLAYVTPSGRGRVIDADSGRVLGGWRLGPVKQLGFSTDGALIAARRDGGLDVYRENPPLRVASVHAAGPGKLRFVDAAWAPGTPDLAYVTYDPATGRSTVWTAADSGRARSQQLFSGAGRISQVAWSPDGKWVMVAWEGADQWVFVRAGGTKAVTRSSITEQLNGSAGGEFPAVAGWCCAAQ
jgi:hypothetical protein